MAYRPIHTIRCNRFQNKKKNHQIYFRYTNGERGWAHRNETTTNTLVVMSTTSVHSVDCVKSARWKSEEKNKAVNESRSVNSINHFASDLFFSFFFSSLGCTHPTERNSFVQNGMKWCFEMKKNKKKKIKLPNDWRESVIAWVTPYLCVIAIRIHIYTYITQRSPSQSRSWILFNGIDPINIRTMNKWSNDQIYTHKSPLGQSDRYIWPNWKS